MTFIDMAVLMIDAAHIFILMRFCRNYIGQYRVERKTAGISFAAYWVLSCYIRFLPFSHRFSAAGINLFFMEFIFLSAVSFFYRGNLFRRLAAAFILPFLYWGMGYAVMRTFFHTARLDNGQYLLCEGISAAIFLALELVLEKVQKSKQEKERELLEQEICMYENQFEIIHQTQKNIYALKHDLKHHLKMLTDFVSAGEKEAALKYLSDMGAFMENGEEYICSGNERIDSILNYAVSRAKAKKIDVSWKILIPEHLDISTFDINVILSNLFDNALNALSKVSEPNLYILMKYDRGILCINIQNNCAKGQLAEDNKRLAAAPVSEHGYGLKNVARIVEKYHGKFTASCADGIFTAGVILFMSDVSSC